MDATTAIAAQMQLSTMTQGPASLLWSSLYLLSFTSEVASE
jgi:hypothetical protein